MKSTVFLIVVGCASALLIGCEEKPAAPVASPVADTKPNGPVQDVALSEVKYDLAIDESPAEPKQYGVTWTAHVNSDGWSMKTDNVLVEEYNGMMACRIWVTLEQPNPSETFTQAPQTITGKHDAKTTKIGRVEFSVRQVVRGVNYSGPAAYSVVKSIKYPY